jgi:hypothetical protein
MKTLEKADLQTILEKTSAERLHLDRDTLCDKLLSIIAPYTEKGIADVEAELDFCGVIEEALDSGGIGDADERVAVGNAIYDALGFPHFWKG